MQLILKANENVLPSPNLDYTLSPDPEKESFYANIFDINKPNPLVSYFLFLIVFLSNKVCCYSNYIPIPESYTDNSISSLLIQEALIFINPF